MAEPTKTRRPKARDPQVVIGAISEVARMIGYANDPDYMHSCAARIEELLDEIARGLRKDNGKDDE